MFHVFCFITLLLSLFLTQFNCLKKLLFFFIGLTSTSTAFPQVQFSIATGASLLRNFSPHQKFWGFGQEVEGDFHFSKKNTAYAWINYHTQGSFTNSFMATAKSPATMPQQMPYPVKGKWKFRQVSLGWKHYFKGAFNAETDLNLYGAAGFGLLFAKVQNMVTALPDAALYELAPTPVIGSDEFKRLTFDFAAGAEYPLTVGIFFFADVRTSLPASDFPLHIYISRNVYPCL